jgi:uncharacterized protein YcbX
VALMRVLELWRYPVKSLQGEQVDEIGITSSGLDGDRGFAIFDVETGLGLTARRVPAMLYGSARWIDGDKVEITLPDGSVATDDDALSTWLGQRVTLRAAHTPGARQFENPADFEHEDTTAWQVWDGSPLAFHDSARTAVSLISTATLAGWDRRRFRANVVLDGDGEDDLVGTQVGVGDAVLDVGKRISRCVMTTRPQPGGIERDLDVLRTINRERDGYLAVGALVVRPGTVRVGDRVLPAVS